MKIGQSFDSKFSCRKWGKGWYVDLYSLQTIVLSNSPGSVPNSLMVRQCKKVIRQFCFCFFSSLMMYSEWCFLQWYALKPIARVMCGSQHVSRDTLFFIPLRRNIRLHMIENNVAEWLTFRSNFLTLILLKVRRSQALILPH